MVTFNCEFEKSSINKNIDIINDIIQNKISVIYYGPTDFNSEKKIYWTAPYDCEIIINFIRSGKTKEDRFLDFKEKYKPGTRINVGHIENTNKDRMKNSFINDSSRGLLIRITAE